MQAKGLLRPVREGELSVDVAFHLARHQAQVPGMRKSL
jgi:hypothetical protein